MTVALDTKYTLNGWLDGSAGDFAYGNVVTVSSFMSLVTAELMNTCLQYTVNVSAVRKVIIIIINNLELI